MSIKIKLIFFMLLLIIITSMFTGIIVGKNTEKLLTGSDSTELKKDTIKTMFYLVTATLILIIIFAFSIIRPVDQMIIATQLIAEGHYKKIITTNRKDELGRLAKSFNDMMGKLDSSTKRRTELSDIASLEKYKVNLIIDAMADGVIVTDDNYHVSIFNPSAEKIFDIDSQKIIGTHIAHFLKKYNMNKALESFPNIDKSKVLPIKNPIITSFEINLTKPLNRIIKVTIAPVRNEKNLIRGSVIVIEDITKIKEIDEMKNDFISTVSHELRTPLTNIMGYSNLLNEGKFGKLGPNQKKALTIVCKESDSLYKLINDILDLSKIESGKLKINIESVHLKEIIESCPTLKLPEKKDIKLDLIFSDDLPMVEVDKTKLAQVFTNLISNATKFTPKGGKITIKTQKWKSFVKIDIIDSGIGIKKSELPKLFNKFYQVENHLTRSQTGTGLGLPIIKEIIGLHNGLLSIDSNPGKGTKVSFIIPIKYKEKENKILCWEKKNCKKIKCPAYKANDNRCWLQMGTFCKKNSTNPCFNKIDICSYCEYYRGDDIENNSHSR